MTNQARKTPLTQLERLILEASPHELMSALALRFSTSSKPMTRKIQYKIDIPRDEWVKFTTPTAPRSLAHAWDEAEKFADEFARMWRKEEFWLRSRLNHAGFVVYEKKVKSR